MLYCLTYGELTALHESVIFAFSGSCGRVDGLPSLVTPSLYTRAFMSGRVFYSYLKLIFCRVKEPCLCILIYDLSKDLPVS